MGINVNSNSGGGKRIANSELVVNITKIGRTIGIINTDTSATHQKDSIDVQAGSRAETPPGWVVDPDWIARNPKVVKRVRAGESSFADDTPATTKVAVAVVATPVTVTTKDKE